MVKSEASPSVKGRLITSPRRLRIASGTCTTTSNPRTTSKLANAPKLKDITSITKLPSRVGRPPTKVAITQPHGHLIQTTNGVRKILDVRTDDLSSTTTTGIGVLDENGTAAHAPAASAGSKEKRVLRSKDGTTRTKSDLALFFPEYEEFVFGPEKKPDYLTLNSKLYITNKHGKDDARSPSRTSSSSIAVRPSSSAFGNNSAFESTSSPHPLPDVEKLNLASYNNTASGFSEDPLPDAMFFVPHKRAERHEKQLRNIEKDRAVYERGELERLREELKGADWLKTLGISGITDTEKKKFEPFRNHYLRAVQCLIDKFAAWKEQEKSLKQKRPMLLAKKENQSAKADNKLETDEEEEDVQGEDPAESPVGTNEEDPSARQLLQEAKTATRFTSIKQYKPQAIPTPVPKPELENAFKSFYSKPHLRAAAIGRHRRGRNMSAFGHLLPDMQEQDFVLPDDIRSVDAVIASARKRRRLKRESKDSL